MCLDDMAGRVTEEGLGLDDVVDARVEPLVDEVLREQSVPRPVKSDHA